jgi:hypothetical protein
MRGVRVPLHGLAPPAIHQRDVPLPEVGHAAALQVIEQVFPLGAQLRREHGVEQREAGVLERRGAMVVREHFRVVEVVGAD